MVLLPAPRPVHSVHTPSPHIASTDRLNKASYHSIIHTSSGHNTGYNAPIIQTYHAMVTDGRIGGLRWASGDAAFGGAGGGAGGGGRDVCASGRSVHAGRAVRVEKNVHGNFMRVTVGSTGRCTGSERLWACSRMKTWRPPQHHPKKEDSCEGRKLEEWNFQKIKSGATAASFPYMR